MGHNVQRVFGGKIILILIPRAVVVFGKIKKINVDDYKRVSNVLDLIF